MTVHDIFHERLPIIAPLALRPLPGSPRYGGSLDAVIERALADLTVLEAGGVDGVCCENLGDAPFFTSEAPPETVAALGAVMADVRRATALPCGVNVLRNCSRAALALAHAFGGRFIRVNVLTEAYVTDQGIIEGSAAELMRVRRLIGADDVAVFADVQVKHAAPLLVRSIAEAALDAVERGLADVLIVSGTRTGSPASADDVQRVRAVGPTLIGSGLTPDNAPDLLPRADGAIVGTYFHLDGIIENPVDPGRVDRFMGVVRRLRQT